MEKKKLIEAVLSLLNKLAGKFSEHGQIEKYYKVKKCIDILEEVLYS